MNKKCTSCGRPIAWRGKRAIVGGHWAHLVIDEDGDLAFKKKTGCKASPNKRDTKAKGIT